MKKKWMRLMTILLLTTLWQSVAVAQTKIAVITDTHVMAPDLLVNDGTAWQNKLASDRKLLDYSQRIFDYLVDKFKSGEDKPDLLLLTGDLTKDGELLSHQYVAGRLKELKAAGVKVYGFPAITTLTTAVLNRIMVQPLRKWNLLPVKVLLLSMPTMVTAIRHATPTR